MLITIVQTEIEQAIRDYVGNQLKIADGMEMSIALSATRGDEGFKAAIDIHPIANAPKQEQLKATTASVPGKSPIFTPRVISATPVSQDNKGTEKSNEPGTDSLADEAGSGEKSNEQPPVATEDATGEGQKSETETANADTPASASRSLFKGLSKPKNS